MRIELSFKNTDRIWQENSKRRILEIYRGLRNQLDAEMATLVERIRDKLSGGVLSQQSGHLYRSVKPIKAEGDRVITAGVVAGGDAAPYGIYFERGGTHRYAIHPKKGRAVAFGVAGPITEDVYSGAKHWRRKSFGRAHWESGVAQYEQAGGIVRAYVKDHPAIPKRPFMAPAWAESKEGIINRLKARVAYELK